MTGKDPKVREVWFVNKTIHGIRRTELTRCDSAPYLLINVCKYIDMEISLVDVQSLAAVLQALSDPVRLRLMRLLLCGEILRIS